MVLITMLLISTDVVILHDLCSFFQTYQNALTSLPSIINTLQRGPIVCYHTRSLHQAPILPQLFLSVLTPTEEVEEVEKQSLQSSYHI